MTRLTFTLLFLLSGCVCIPDCEYASMNENTGLENVGFGQWPNSEWWKEFQDPTLDHLIESSLAFSPTLKLAEARLKAAAEVTKERWSYLFPELAFDGNTNYEHFSKFGFFRSVAPTVPPVINDITLNLTYKWEIDFWGKNRDLLAAAVGEMDALAAEVEQAKLILTSSIAYDYAELQFLLRKKQILEEKEYNERAILKVRSQREKNALDTALVVLSAENGTLNVETQIADLDQQILEHIHELKALSGLGQDAELDIELRPFKLAVSLPENLPLDLIARRPDLAAQKMRVEAAAKRIGAAKTDFYPSVNLMGYAGLESIHWNKIFKVASFNGSLEPAIHLPIFTAGRIRAQLMEKVAEFNEAVEQYNRLILDAAQDVADRLSDILQIEKQMALRQNSLEVLAKQEKLTRRRVEHALDDSIALYNIQNNLLDTELLFAGLEYGKQLANILLIRSLGGGMHAP